MTTIDVRRSRAVTGPPLFLLPVALLVVLFGVAVLLAQVAPARVSSGIYQVIVWEGTSHVVIPTESLDYVRTGGTATCTTLVGPHRLTIDIGYAGVVEPSTCTARHGDRAVSCRPQMGYYGHASHTVWITDGLGLSGTQQADLRAAVPWWRVESELGTVVLALIGTLGAAAGASTFLLRRRARPAPPDRRLHLVAGTAVLGLGLFAATVPVFNSPMGTALIALSPFSLLAAATLAAWQWQLSGTPRGGRVVSAIVAAAAVTIYSGVAMLIFLLQSGFVD